MKARPSIVLGARERWLEDMLHQCRVKLFRPRGIIVPECSVSVGFPLGRRVAKGKSASGMIGQCWNAAAAADGKAAIFVSPILDQADVGHVLVHEAVHAATPGAGHKGEFRKAALAVGLTGKMTATTAGPELEAFLTDCIGLVGPYPHGVLNSDLAEKRKKQGTRLLKAWCEGCGYTCRVAAKWLGTGAPICPACEQSMVSEVTDEGSGDDE